jgi:hypothetical protein
MREANCASESRPYECGFLEYDRRPSASIVYRTSRLTAIRKVRGWVRDDSEKLSPRAIVKPRRPAPVAGVWLYSLESSPFLAAAASAATVHGGTMPLTRA